ncbi:MAG: ribonuclease HI [Firmicutes bacterium]|nr:ribonuclease HI [Bacillota bacterium]
MERVVIYTDGACSGNPGPGGWAALIMKEGEKTREISGGVPRTTNQRMEMLAPIMALKELDLPATVMVYSDSAYLVNAFNQGWLERWLKNGWCTSSGHAVKNRDLWEELDRLTGFHHQVAWRKVKGHGTDSYNIRCDRLARQAIPAQKDGCSEGDGRLF